MVDVAAILFDLDGTLIDSLDDITVALAAALTQVSLPAPRRDQVRSWLGDGARALIERAVAGRGDVDRVLADFRARYAAAPVVHTRLYQGMAAALDHLAAGRRFAVVSNKPHDLTRVIAHHLLAPWPFGAVLGQHPDRPIKPDPAMMRLAAAELEVAAAQCLVVGDSPVDVTAGRAAGMRTVAVTWGFRDRDALLATGADAVVDDIDQLVRAVAGG